VVAPSLSTGSRSAAVPAPPVGCQISDVHLSWAPGQPSPAPVCLRIGAQVSITLYPPELHLWTTPVSSRPQVAAVVASGSNQEGAMAITVHTAAPGSTVLSSVAQPSDGAPDPHDVPWQLTVTVTA
jgi:hypothetical protein